MNKEINEKLGMLRGAIHEGKYPRPKKGELQCTDCMKIFPDVDTWKAHFKTCEPEFVMRKFDCPDCGFHGAYYGHKDSTSEKYKKHTCKPK